MTERPTIRPVTLSRLVEITYICELDQQTTTEVESTLEVSHQRAREAILEALRIDLIKEQDRTDEEYYTTTCTGEEFLEAVRTENWLSVSNILEEGSPHYSAFLGALEVVEPATLEVVLDKLETQETHTDWSYNQTSIEVLGDWAERLERIQRNAFTGSYYSVDQTNVPEDFVYVLLTVFDELEETAGVTLRQRYLSIPKLREYFCERVGCPRSEFDDTLLMLVQENVGKMELSGAPVDTGAKDAKLGIKEMHYAGNDGLVSTSQSTERVMAGVEQFGKQYYYLAIHDRDLTFTPNTNE